MSEGTRLNKYLSEKGICSRREAVMWIAAGRVIVNGKRPQAGDRINAGDEVRVDGRIVSVPEDPHVYIALHKPPGIVSTTDKAEKENIIDFVRYPRRIFPVGRLDKPSEGLILLTSDGDIVNKILRAGNKHEKEYEVTVSKPITPAFIEGMAGGVPIMGTMTKKCRVEMLTPHIFRIVLVQGMNRQVRRMCEHFGYDVKKLKRIRIMNLHLDIPLGEWRELTETEITGLLALTDSSDKVQTATIKKKPKQKPSDPAAPKPKKVAPKKSIRARSSAPNKHSKKKTGGRGSSRGKRR